MSWFSAVEPASNDSPTNGSPGTGANAASPGTGANAASPGTGADAITLSPELFAKIKAIQIRTQRIVNDVFAGEYESAFKGRGLRADRSQSGPAG